MLYIEDGVYRLGHVQGIGNTLAGTILVESGATPERSRPSRRLPEYLPEAKKAMHDPLGHYTMSKKSSQALEKPLSEIQ